MPIIASFTASQSALGTDLTIHDTTDYSEEAKSTFSARVLKLYKSDGTMYPNGLLIPFSFADYPNDKITIPSIYRDFAFNIVLELTSNAADPASTYTKSIVVALTSYTMQFLFGINQEISANPGILDKANFYHNLQCTVIELSNAMNAVANSNLTSAQSALDRANKFISNKNLYF